MGWLEVLGQLGSKAVDYQTARKQREASQAELAAQVAAAQATQSRSNSTLLMIGLGAAAVVGLIVVAR